MEFKPSLAPGCVCAQCSPWYSWDFTWKVCIKTRPGSLSTSRWGRVRISGHVAWLKEVSLCINICQEFSFYSCETETCLLSCYRDNPRDHSVLREAVLYTRRESEPGKPPEFTVKSVNTSTFMYCSFSVVLFAGQVSVHHHSKHHRWLRERIYCDSKINRALKEWKMMVMMMGFKLPVFASAS